MTFVGLIFQCNNGLFVKVEKEGTIETASGKLIEGYLGREITKLGNPLKDYMYWNKNGINERDSDWNLRESDAGIDRNQGRYQGWPKGT
jgi:hypothetical protein